MAGESKAGGARADGSRREHSAKSGIAPTWVQAPLPSARDLGPECRQRFGKTIPGSSAIKRRNGKCCNPIVMTKSAMSFASDSKVGLNFSWRDFIDRLDQSS